MRFPLASSRRRSQNPPRFQRQSRRRRLWALEGLEGRVLLSGNPTYYTVNLTSDTGASSGTDAYPAAGTPSGDLLWAVAQANGDTNPAGSVIDFDPTVFATTQTITLSSTLALSESAGPEVIAGPSAGVVISGNNAVGVFQVCGGVTATLSGLTISGGSATNGGGINNCGTVTVIDSTIDNSYAGTFGGGVDNSGTLVVNDCTIADNSANAGGGIENAGMLTLTNSIVAGNRAGNNGGGIDNFGTLTAVNATIAHNYCNQLSSEDGGGGGGVYDETGRAAVLDNTIVALNTNDFTVPDDISGGSVSSVSANNLIGTGGSGGLTSGSYGNLVDVADPGLAAGLANDGGPTQTIALLPGSPAIGAGAMVPLSSLSATVNASATQLTVTSALLFAPGMLLSIDGEVVDVVGSNLPANTLTVQRGVDGTSAAAHAGGAGLFLATDQRGAGFPRVVNGAVDIGAFESPIFGSPTVYTVNLATDCGPTSAGSGSGSAGDLRYCITQANANTNPAGSVIEFDPTVFATARTIRLSATLGTLELSEAPWPEVIQGPGANAVTISGNNAVGVFQVDGATTATLSGLTISDGNSGGSGRNGGGIVNSGALTVTGCTIADNSPGAGFGSGGGIANDGGSLTVTNSTIEDNTAGFVGGGVFNGGGAAMLTDCVIEGNAADNGGGVYDISGSVAMNGCTISDNSAQRAGGGIFLGFGSLTLTNSTITGNSASLGAVFVSATTLVATSMRVTNSTIADNPGIGIYVLGGLTALPFTLTLDNSIVACNNGESSGTADLNMDGPSDFLVADNNLIGVGSGGLMNGCNGNIVGTPTAPINPLLGPLQNNGGPTPTMALLPDSPAIDAGSATIPGVTVATTDQRGALRGPAGLNAGSTVDIGAYEASSSYLVTSTAASTDVDTLQTAIGWASVSTNANPANLANPAPNTIVFAPPDTQSLDQDLAAIGSLAVSNRSPLPITIDLSSNVTYQNVNGSGSTVPIDVTAPSGVALTLNGPPSGTATLYDLVTSGTVTVQGNITVIGNSPALVVDSGLATIANGVTLVTATNAPTIQVNGGTLVIRNSTVEQESTTSSQPAIQVNGGSADLGTTASPGGNTLDVNGTGALIEDTTGSPVSAAGDTFESNGTTVPSSFGNVKLSAPASQTANQGVPQPFSLGSLADSVQDSQSWAVDVNWGDGSAHTAFSAASTGALSAQIHAFALPGTYTVTFTATDPVTGGASAWNLVQTFTVTVAPSAFILDPTAGGALSLSGNATLKIPGAIVVDSISSSALSASGNAQIKASAIDVHGKVPKSGNASFSPTPVTGAAAIADPLSGLSVPVASTLGLASQGSVSLSGNSAKTIGPGVYTKISLSGNASLTLNPGVYIITGGGLAVSGNASVSVSGPPNAVTGTGVMIYNAGSGYNSTTGADGGSFGAITLSGNGSINLAPPSAGTYAGILVFQARDNAKALSFSGNALQGVTGVIYAPAAQLAESGNSQIGSTSNPISIVVDTLSASGNAVADGMTLSAPSGSVAYTPAQIRAAYGISALALDGTGQTIAIVDAYDDPEIDQALDAFDSQFGLTASGPTLYAQYGPASSFLTVLNQNGQATSLPSTDPNGPGTDNWEVEEALDVEWAHAIAPGAQIVLVEANSQSLSDLMASVATAAGQPGVSVVSMSWGFPEGQAVFAADEAAYDSVFNVPGVTFVASTGDYGAADPEYPAFSPNVVAVGGTSLTLNADGSYNSETGWGYYSNAAGAFIGSGGGISLYEPEPAYQNGVQSTGGRTTPDVSLVADPATGAWIADPYNLDPSDPFEVVGGTSLSAPAWAGLLALIDQGRSAAGEPALNSASPVEVQQALYSLPQSDYNTITSGNNGYSASAGYNLVTGLGTPVASSLVPDLIAYQGPGTTYSGPPVSPLQNSGLVNTGTCESGPMDVFSVFDSFPVTSVGQSRAHGKGSNRVESALGYGMYAAGRTFRPLANFQESSPGGRVLAAGVGLAQPLARPETVRNSVVDQVLGALPDTKSRDTLIGDLAFEQVASGVRKPRGNGAI